MSKASGKILLRKDPDLCFKINIDGFHTARVRLWSQNHPTNPPTPDLSISIVVTIFRETLLVYFILLKVKKKMIQILTWLVLIVVLNKNFPKLASVFIPIKNFVQRSKRFLLCPAPGTWYSRAGSEMFKLTRPANAWCSKKAVAIISRPNVSI